MHSSLSSCSKILFNSMKWRWKFGTCGTRKISVKNRNVAKRCKCLICIMSDSLENRCPPRLSVVEMFHKDQVDAFEWLEYLTKNIIFSSGDTTAFGHWKMITNQSANLASLGPEDKQRATKTSGWMDGVRGDEQKMKRISGSSGCRGERFPSQTPTPPIHYCRSADR